MRWYLLLVALAAGVHPALTRWYEVQPVPAGGLRHPTMHRRDLQAAAASLDSEHYMYTAADVRTLPSAVRRLLNADSSDIQGEVSLHPAPDPHKPGGNCTATLSPGTIQELESGIQPPFDFVPISSFECLI
jgi:hypothetical protein